MTGLRNPIDKTYIRETFSAACEWTLVRLIASVGTAMDSQGAALNECLVAGFVVAGVGAFIGMYSIVTLEVRLPVETL